MSPKGRFVRVGKRGENAFRRNDAIRAVKAARDAGVEPAVFEIVAKDGTIFRVYADNAAQTESIQDTGAKAWDAEIAKLKATPKGGKE
jgi:hypothetical protein